MSLTSRGKNESVFLKKSIQKKKQNVLVCSKDNKNGFKSINWKVQFTKLVIDKRFISNNSNSNNKLYLDIKFCSKTERINLGIPLGTILPFNFTVESNNQNASQENNLVHLTLIKKSPNVFNDKKIGFNAMKVEKIQNDELFSSNNRDITSGLNKSMDNEYLSYTKSISLISNYNYSTVEAVLHYKITYFIKFADLMDMNLNYFDPNFHSYNLINESTSNNNPFNNDASRSSNKSAINQDTELFLNTTKATRKFSKRLNNSKDEKNDLSQFDHNIIQHIASEPTPKNQGFQQKDLAKFDLKLFKNQRIKQSTTPTTSKNDNTVNGNFDQKVEIYNKKNERKMSLNEEFSNSLNEMEETNKIETLVESLKNQLALEKNRLEKQESDIEKIKQIQKDKLQKIEEQKIEISEQNETIIKKENDIISEKDEISQSWHDLMEYQVQVEDGIKESKNRLEEKEQFQCIDEMRMQYQKTKANDFNENIAQISNDIEVMLKQYPKFRTYYQEKFYSKGTENEDNELYEDSEDELSYDEFLKKNNLSEQIQNKDINEKKKLRSNLDMTDRDTSKNSDSSQPKFQKISFPSYGKNTVNIKEKLEQRKYGDQYANKILISENNQNLDSKVGYSQTYNQNTIYAKFSNTNSKNINKSANLRQTQAKLKEKVSIFNEDGSHKRSNSFPFESKNTNFNGLANTKHLNKICINDIYLKKLKESKKSLNDLNSDISYYSQIEIMLQNKIKKLRLENKISPKLNYSENKNMQLSTKESYNDSSYSNMLLSNTSYNSLQFSKTNMESNNRKNLNLNYELMQDTPEIYGMNFRWNFDNKKNNITKKSPISHNNINHSDMKLQNSLLYNQAGVSNYNNNIQNYSSKNTQNFMQNLSDQKTVGSTNLQSSELTFLTNKLLRESDVLIEKKN